MTIYEHLPRLKHTNNLLLGLTCGGIDLVCHIKENEVVQPYPTIQLDLPNLTKSE